jgi:hypothetical protein
MAAENANLARSTALGIEPLVDKLKDYAYNLQRGNTVQADLDLQDVRFFSREAIKELVNYI